MDTFNDKGFGQAFRGEGHSPRYGFTNTYTPPAYAGPALDALAMFLVGPALGRGLAAIPRITQRLFAPAAETAAPAATRPSPSDMLGGVRVLEAPRHFSQDTRSLSSDPRSWAQALAQRQAIYDEELRKLLAEGVSEAAARAQLKRANLAPPGINETEGLRLFKPHSSN
jgi:hypothetical protein